MSQHNLLKQLLFDAVMKLYGNDSGLFLQSGLENACVVKIIYYMQDMLSNDSRFHEWKHYNIDYEYNKSVFGLKKVRHTESEYIKPDLLLHIRGTDANNLMVVEFKKDRKSSESDILKLRDLTDPYQNYKYKLGCAVSLTKRAVIYTFVEDGEVTEPLLVPIV